MTHRLIYVMCLTWLGLILIAPIFATHNPRQTDPTNTQASPTVSHLFGTDNLGRDVYSRTLHGGQRTLLISLGALSIAVMPSLVLSMLALLTGKMGYHLISILLDALLAFPSLLIALVVLALMGRGANSILIAVGIAQLPYMLRVTLIALEQQQHQPYVTAAKSLGATHFHIIRHHLLSNARPTIASYTSITFAYCVMNSAALSLLGLGDDPSIPDWGVMLATGRDTFRYAPWTAIAPAIAISITIMLANKLADQLR